MRTVDIITVSGNACALVLTALLLIGTLAGGNLGSKINRRFLAMLGFCIPGSLIEMVYPILQYVPGAGVAVSRDVILSADYVFAGGICIAFGMYLYEFLAAKSRTPGGISKTPFIVMCCVYNLNIPLVALYQLNQVFGFLGDTITTNISGLVQIASLIPVFSVIIAIAITLHSIKAQQLTAKEWMPLLLYCIVPLPVLVLEFASPRIWLTWFGTTVSMFLIYLNIQVEQGKKLKEQELAMAESRTAIMLSQIQPHFMYNALTAIEYLCNRDGARQAGKVVRDFSKYLRGNMRALSHKRPIPFLQELEHTQLYLSIEQLQYEERLHVVYDIQSSDFSLPALTLQPLVENAVKHGVSKREQGGTVHISTEETDAQFRVVVLDDGVGFSPAAGTRDGRLHIGINNVRQRVENLCGGSLAIESAPGRGSKAVLSIPKQTPEGAAP